ncbi:hypothetical protein HN873_047982 [Arachis hypogaea]
MGEENKVVGEGEKKKEESVGATAVVGDGEEEKNKKMKKSKKQGLISRIWKGIFRRRSDDFEKRLQYISKEEAAVMARVNRSNRSWQRTSRQIIIIFVIFEDDESLRRWKEQLLGNVYVNNVTEVLEPEVKIISLSIVSPGREDIVLPIPENGNPKGLWSTLKEGSPYRLKFTFVVSNNIVFESKTIQRMELLILTENQDAIDAAIIGALCRDRRKQVYLGEFDTTHAAARAYDRAAIKFRGIDADINFNVSDYHEDIKGKQLDAIQVVLSDLDEAVDTTTGEETELLVGLKNDDQHPYQNSFFSGTIEVVEAGGFFTYYCWNLEVISMYDDVTANISNVLPVSKQLEYFEHYKIHMRKLLGEKRAEFIIRNALYVISMGTNDFLQNYFLEDTRPKQYSLQKFEEFLLSQMTKDIEVEVGTRSTDASMDEWLEGTVYAQSNANKSKKKK